jgi:LytR cell envelope-related transcriptional attenuator
MSTLTPSGGRRRRRGRAFSVLLVGIAALVVGAAVGWSLTNREPDPTTAPPTTSGCPSPQVSTSGSPGASPSVKAAASPKPLPSPSSITVDVFNATTRQGLAKTTAKQLEQRGFVIGDVANDPADSKITGTAVVRYGPKGKNQAKVVAAQVPSSKLVNDKRTDRSVSLALGEAYTNLATPEQAAATLAPKPSPSC